MGSGPVDNPETMHDALVGRTKELNELRSAVDASVGGAGALVLVAGVPGIGKTRLVEAAATYAAAAGADVLRATCWEGPTAAFWPWAQLLRDRVGAGGAPEVVRLTDARLTSDEDVTSAGDAEPARVALFDAAARAVRALAARRPLVCVVDDLHWADVPSLRLLEVLARDVHRERLLIIGTFRDVELARGTEVAAALERLSAVGSVVHLDGLNIEDVSELLRSVQPDLPIDIAGVVHDRTGGNPLFVRELARLLAVRGGSTDPASLAVPPGINSVLERRLARLSQRCNEFLSMAAVFGHEFRSDVIGRVLDLSVDDTLAMIDEALTSQLVVDTGRVGRYAFSHALVRDVLYNAIPLPQRARSHAAAAGALPTGLETSDAELAHHHLLAATPDHAAKAIDHSVSAARIALDRLAYEDAVAHLRRALDALEIAPDDDRRMSVLLELGDALIRAGDMPGARATFSDIATYARMRDRPDDLARAALGLGAGLTGFEIRMADQAQVELLEEALERLGPQDSPLRARALARLSVALSYRESIERRTLIAADAVDMARLVADEAVLAAALAAYCDAIAGPADTERRIAAATEIVEIAATRTADRPSELLGRRLLVKAFLETGDLPSASAQMDAFAWTASRLRQPLYSWYVELWKGMRAQIDGSTSDAMAHADDAETVGARAHSINAPMLAVVLRSVALFQAERYDELRPEYDRLEELTSYVEEYADYYHGTLSALLGDLEAATPRVRRFARQRMPKLAMDAEWLPGAAMFSEALRIVGDDEGAAALYEQLLPFRSRFAIEGIGAGTYGSVELHLGLLAATFGRRAEAEEHFTRAIEANARLGAPLLVARGQLELAAVLRERGDDTRADDLMHSAKDVRERLLGPRERSEPARAQPAGAVLVRDGELWVVSFDRSTVRVKDAKGLHDLATLLRRPGREVAALDLATERSAASRTVDGDLGSPGHAGELLDDDARASYKARLDELDEEIAAADDLGDPVRGERAREERDAIVGQLTAAYGLGGRARRVGDPSERARTTVTRRIRDAIGRIEAVHPQLGLHLRNSVRTGTFCSYVPEHPVAWELDRLTT